MKGIPPEIDTLLWAVAEDESPRAGDEFVARYPKYAGELARRRQMVKGLKGVRPATNVASRARPAFRPAPVRTQPIPRRTLVGVGALVLAAIAVASYTAATFATPAPHRQTPAPPVANHTPVIPSPPVVIYKEPPVTSVPDPSVPAPSVPNDPDPVLDPKANKGQNFKVKGADLAGALAMLGAEAGVNIIVAPGMAKRQIDAEYENTPLNEILADMGKRYGFTPFDQGDGSIIIVPAVEGGGDTPTESRPRPTERHSIERRGL